MYKKIYQILEETGKVKTAMFLNDRASHSRYFSDELDAQFFC